MTDFNNKNWIKNTYRRFSVDIHVPDWDPALLSKFEPEKYVECIAKGGFKSLLHYTNSHAGLCLYKTKIGQMHKNMGDRDFFGEVVAACRKHDIHPLAYFSVGHDNWAFAQHPDWRIIHAGGITSRINSRYGFACYNSPYREYVRACVTEIASNYDIDGMFFDMTFWPGVCYCAHCTERFYKEEGYEPPRKVDWDDPKWRVFQAARERWLMDFAHLATNAAKAARPGITVNHQYATMINNYLVNMPLEMRDACDYVGGDFYGGAIQQSLACKAFESLTLNKPFEFHTSRTRHFIDHVTVKSMDELRQEAYVATLHSSALMLVDYINADGTLNEDVYEYLGRLNSELAQYEPYLGGELLADVAVYFDKRSQYDPREKDWNIDKWDVKTPHLDAVVGAAKVLQEAHIPFGVVTNITLEQLSRYRAVILPSVFEMTAEQAEIFRSFVNGGGVIIATGSSSMDRLADGVPRYLLEDVMGVKYIDEYSWCTRYITPKDDALTESVWPQDHVLVGDNMQKAQALPGAEVIATITLPFVDPLLGTCIDNKFAAIHSNPPALEAGAEPAIVINSYGKGKSAWICAPVEKRDEAANNRLILALLKKVLPGPYHFEVETHPSVEMTLYHQPEKKRMLVSLLNMQKQFPQISVPAKISIRPEGNVKGIVRLPDLSEMPFWVDGEYVRFDLEPFGVFAMFAVDLDTRESNY